jgi:uncharacterized protein YjbI with pentapeptide repeats
MVATGMPKRFALAALGLTVVTAAWAQEAQKTEACPHPKGWKPTLDRAVVFRPMMIDKKLLAWLRKNKNENLCNVDLSGAQLANADLSGIKLNGAKLNSAMLIFAKLNNADLAHAELNNADLSGANLKDANLGGTALSNVVLYEADLSGAELGEAKLNNADLRSTKLNGARLFEAELKGTLLARTKLHNADLSFAKLNRANMLYAELNGADLRYAELNGAFLMASSVAGARLANTDLTEAVYAPASAPPDPHVAGIKGLSTVTFPVGDETGLVELRDLLQKAGARDLEREATFAIELGKTKYSLDQWKQNPAGAAEGVFRYVAFDLTTRYGMRPSRALLLIGVLWLLLIPMYAWPIWQRKRPSNAGSIYRIWPQKRIEIREHKPTLDNPDYIERLHGRGLAAVGWSAYFSLLSAFQVGYREFSIGSWLSRAQPRDFMLASTGWVRTVSGIQSLLSVYLLAMWVLTYFGRPFQ